MTASTTGSGAEFVPTGNPRATGRAANATHLLYTDGSAAAPHGSAQWPALLSQYAARPPWKVAGVDYAVGPRSAPTLDPASIDMTGVSVDAAKHAIRISGDHVTLSGYDFARDGGYNVIVAGNNDTITNSHFVMGRNPALSLVQDYGNDMTLSYNTLDGTATTENQSGLVAIIGVNPVIEYNWFKNFGQHVIEMQQSGKVESGLVYRYNLIESGDVAVGAHLNYLQFAGGHIVNPVVEYNTTIQTPEVAPGEGFQSDSYAGAIITGALYAYNTMIAKGPASASSPVATSYLMHLEDGSTGAALDNYMDVSSAYGGFYPVKEKPLWIYAGNTDVTKSGLLSIQGAVNAASPGPASIAAGPATASDPPR